MTNRNELLLGVLTLVCAAAVLPAASLLESDAEVEQTAAASQPVMPKYGDDRALQLPQDWRRWVFVGSSLGLSYAQGGPSGMGMEMFHETLIEPTAYQHFADTGTFREGTQFVLVLHGTGEGVLPARRGRFASELHGVEMAVKDSKHRPEGWAYYNFGGMNGIRNTAQAMPKETCFNCHIQHAKLDNVFMQFYPLLADVAPRPSPAHAGAASGAHRAAAGQQSATGSAIPGHSRPGPHSSYRRQGRDGQTRNHRRAQGPSLSVRQRAQSRKVRERPSDVLDPERHLSSGSRCSG